MMLLVAMAITVAFVASAATTLGWFDLEFWWELAALVTIMLLGHWQEMKALGQAGDALAALAALLPDEAERLDADGRPEVFPMDDLVVDDVVLVRSGRAGSRRRDVVDGAAEIDESMITGESRPVPRGVGDRIVAGTVATDSAPAGPGRRRGRRDRPRRASSGSSRRPSGPAAGPRCWPTGPPRSSSTSRPAAAVVTFVAWTAFDSVDEAVVRTVTVLVISCPHALGLAIPLVISLSSALAARNGILVKDRLALERSRTVDAFLFDKTGTLTKAEHTRHRGRRCRAAG